MGEHYLVCARTNESIVSKVATYIGRDHLTIDTVSWYEILILTVLRGQSAAARRCRTSRHCV